MVIALHVAPYHHAEKAVVGAVAKEVALTICSTVAPAMQAVVIAAIVVTVILKATSLLDYT